MSRTVFRGSEPAAADAPRQMSQSRGTRPQRPLDWTESDSCYEVWVVSLPLLTRTEKVSMDEYLTIEPREPDARHPPIDQL
jgi:hypothetical protein